MDEEAFIAHIREHGSRAESTIPAALSELIDCEQMTLESTFIEAKPEPTIVLVHRIDLGQGDFQDDLTSVVKYSPAHYAPSRAEHLKIATARHYRQFEGGGPGVRDEHDAVYQQTIKSYFERWNPDALPLLSPFSTSITVESQEYNVDVVPSGTIDRAADSQWIYCTTLEPRTDAEQASMFKEFDADCMTRIQSPPDLARELGSAFAQKSPQRHVTIDDEAQQLQIDAMKNQSPFESVVHVYHGPVAYTDDPERLVEPLPPILQGSAVPFLKSPGFAHHREYRFTISTIGTPAEDVLYIPVTEEIRALISGMEFRRGFVDTE